MAPSNHDSKQSFSLQDYRVKLDFDKVHLSGRDDEINELYNSYLDSKEQFKIVQVVGQLGTGRTALVETALRNVVQTDGGYFVSGQFQQIMRDKKPYSGLVDALTHLISLIMASPTHGKEISDELLATDDQHSDFETLCNIIPNLNQLMGPSFNRKRKSSFASPRRKSSYRRNWGMERLKVLLFDLLKTICKPPDRRIVIFLDDLHFADTACLSLLSSLAGRKDMVGIMFVWAFQEGNVDWNEFSSKPLTTTPSGEFCWTSQSGEACNEQELFSNFCAAVKKMCGDWVVRIDLDNLAVDAVNDMICKVTKLNAQDTIELAHLVHGKTDGNPFHVKQFLQILQQRNLLEYSLKTFKWEFDCAKISTETEISDNVVDLVSGEIKSLSPSTQRVLKLAACYGYHFDLETLNELMNVDGSSHYEQGGRPQELVLARISEAQLEEMLEEACRLQLLDKCLASGKYKFAHDKIQEAAYMLVPDVGNVRASIHLSIGSFILHEKLNNNNNISGERRPDSYLFAAADQFARCEELVMDEAMKLDLARLDLNVAELAIEKSGFVPAALYLKSGIKHLPGDAWNNNNDYDLTLRLYSLLAQVNFCVGDFKGCKDAVDEILKNAKNLHDQMPAYISLIEFMCAEGGLQESLKIGSTLLSKLLKERFPRSPSKVHVLVELVKTNRIMRGKTDEDLLQKVEVLKDEDGVHAMNLMSLLLAAAWLAVEPELLATLTLRMVKLSCLNGLTKHSALGYACYGFLLARLGKHSEGYRFGLIAGKLLRQFDAPEAESAVMVSVHVMINHLRQPYHESLEPLLYGHRIGMETGDISSATLCLVGYMTTYLFCGLPLRPLEEDMMKFGDQMERYGQDAILNVYRLYWQCVHNFQGKSEDPIILTGSVMNEEKMTKLALETNQHVTVQGIWWIRMKLCYFFGDFKTAGMLAKNLTARRKSVDQTTNSSYQKQFYIGLTKLAQAKTAPKNGAFREMVGANKVIRKMHKWVSEGVVNCHHLHLLLLAEKSTLSNGDNYAESGNLFEAAIRSATRSGILHHAALANELYGRHLEEIGDGEGCRLHVTLAYHLYGEWGSVAKVLNLENSYGFLTSQNKSIAGSVSASGSTHSGDGFRGRSRFDAVNASDIHNGKSLRSVSEYK